MEVHRCRFVPYRPSAINALAFSHNSTPDVRSRGPPNLRLAVGRANGDIEIWNPLKGAWYQESIFRGGKDRSIEGLVWTQDPEDVDKNGFKTPGRLRLFSIGYSSVVTEWDLAAGTPMRHSSGNYGEIWCMAAQPKGHLPKTPAGRQEENKEEEVELQNQNIAVGCADGAIVLLNTAEGDLRFSRILARPSKKRSRVLSIAFQNRYTIVAGHADSTVRIYDLRSKQPMRDMTLGPGPKSGPKETLVWSVKCLNDGTIVSGDSTGTLSFWDGRNYTLLQRIKGHEADILEIAISADGQTVFSGSLDRRTSMYRRTGDPQQGEKFRWSKIAHQRFHRHDVKAMAVFETRLMSVLASGGLDTAPIIVPVQKFGRENHRSLSTLPQHPILRSSTRNRLMVSWWDREIRIWRVSRRRSEGNEQIIDSEERKSEGRSLVAMIALQDEEAIAALDLSSDGSILAVSTSSKVKIFHLRPKAGRLKVQKLEIVQKLAVSGAKGIQFSPDQKWLAVIGVDDTVQLYRITKSEERSISPRFLPTVVPLKRLPRDPVKMNYQYGTLGKYNRSITRVAFSADSRILAVADLSGFLDTWVLEGYEDLSQDSDDLEQNSSSRRDSSNQDSDDDSDDEEHPTIILGQHWVRNPSASLIIKLPTSPLILSFRPTSTQSSKAATNGSLAVHPTRHTPHPHSHDLPNGEDRLFVMTAEHQMYEFNVLAGKLSDWSQRNPASRLPQEFRTLKDRAMGLVWDTRSQNQRVWLYGVAWLWMFDLSRDLPAFDGGDNTVSITNGEHRNKQLKRKRSSESEDDESTARPGSDTGAGSKMAKTKIGLGIGPSIHIIDGDGKRKIQAATLPQEPTSESDDDNDSDMANENDSIPVSLQATARSKSQQPRRADGEKLHTDEDATTDEETRMSKAKGPEGPFQWHTYKYRPILGIVAIGGETDDEATVEGKDNLDDGSPLGVEVALVERPLWDVTLPPQFHGDHEWKQ